LEPTVAPFAKPEKPQLSPRLAVSFINNGLLISTLRMVRGDRGAAPNQNAEPLAVWLYLFSFGFLQ
jgi:hypothetical protein